MFLTVCMPNCTREYKSINYEGLFFLLSASTEFCLSCRTRAFKSDPVFQTSVIIDVSFLSALFSCFFVSFLCELECVWADLSVFVCIFGVSLCIIQYISIFILPWMCVCTTAEPTAGSFCRHHPEYLRMLLKTVITAAASLYSLLFCGDWRSPV